jgi:hypothetical protein
MKVRRRRSPGDDGSSRTQTPTTGELTAADAQILAEVARDAAVDADALLWESLGKPPEEARAIAEDTHRDVSPETFVQAARPDYVTQPEAWGRWYREHVECEASGAHARCYLPRVPGTRRCSRHTAAERAA